MNVKKSDKHESGVQMYLSEKEEWTRRVPVLAGVAVSYANQTQVDEHSAGLGKEERLASGLMEAVCSLSNLEKACRRVISNGGSAGIDEMDVKELEGWFSMNWQNLQKELLSGSYVPSAVREVEIPKPKGGFRLLGIPTVKDRLIQQAIQEVLSPLYDAGFSPMSYGFRRGRGAQDALRQLSHYISSGRTYVVDIDLAKFFDEVNHERLMSRLSHRLRDSRLLKLIHRYLRTGILSGGVVNQRIKGTPQGSPLSPLLSNIVLDELDMELSCRGHHYVRYADDVVIVVGSLQAAERVQKSITTYIEKDLRLKVNATKSRICRPLDLNYLGHRFTNGGEILLSELSEARLKDKIRICTQRNRGRKLEAVIAELNTKLRGWLNYFKLAKMKSRLRNLDGWIRKRLRCYRLKQCKRAKGMLRFLTRLGVPKRRAFTTATSRKGWWRKSSTPACQEAMNNNWFTEQGLFNLSEVYATLHT